MTKSVIGGQYSESLVEYYARDSNDCVVRKDLLYLLAILECIEKSFCKNSMTQLARGNILSSIVGDSRFKLFKCSRVYYTSWYYTKWYYTNWYNHKCNAR